MASPQCHRYRPWIAGTALPRRRSSRTGSTGSHHALPLANPEEYRESGRLFTRHKQINGRRKRRVWDKRPQGNILPICHDMRVMQWQCLVRDLGAKEQHLTTTPTPTSSTTTTPVNASISLLRYSNEKTKNRNKNTHTQTQNTTRRVRATCYDAKTVNSPTPTA